MQQQSVEFNPFSQAFQIDPYPIYHQLRSISPIHRIQSFSVDQWYITRYQDVQTILNDPRFTVDDLPHRLEAKASHLKQQGDFNHLIQTIHHWLFFLEPPHHTRLRSLLSRSFSAAKVEQLRPQIQVIVDRLLDHFTPGTPVDVMAQLAAPLPTLVSAELLGIPSSKQATLTQWGSILFRVFNRPLSLQDYQLINQVALEFKEYLQEVVSTLRKSPQTSLISQLIVLRDEENRLSEDELLALIGMLFSVGQETTENLIGNGIFALISHPQQLQTLQQHPALIQSAVEELLRYDSPVQILSRTAIADVELDGTTLRRGDKINLLLGAANRDPARFPVPDQLDIRRGEHSKLPFGSGIHYCLGSELARVQGQIAIHTLVQRFPKLTVEVDRVERRKTIVLRGFKVLPITVTVP
ncbi:MAG: cytochrome P450 [Leptolyngbyaceae cyanobacterium SL_7_1]|nr:cytochrome P450 [Leptolyngbyaceae cyanobacterium SL_7_1]